MCTRRHTHTQTYIGNSVCTSGSIRLVDSQSSRERRIQHCVNRKWFPYCTRHSLSPKTASLIVMSLDMYKTAVSYYIVIILKKINMCQYLKI